MRSYWPFVGMGFGILTGVIVISAVQSGKVTGGTVLVFLPVLIAFLYCAYRALGDIRQLRG